MRIPPDERPIETAVREGMWRFYGKKIRAMTLVMTIIYVGLTVLCCMSAVSQIMSSGLHLSFVSLFNPICAVVLVLWGVYGFFRSRTIDRVQSAATRYMTLLHEGHARQEALDDVSRQFLKNASDRRLLLEWLGKLEAKGF